MSVRRCVRITAAVLALLAASLTTAFPSASRASEGHETLISLASPVTGDFVGGAEDRFFFPGAYQIQISGTAEMVTVRAEDESGQEGPFNFRFEAPRGRQLVPGSYESASEWPYPDDGGAGMAISGDHRACEVVDGRFDVLSIESDSSDQVTSLWIVFEQHCDRHPQASVGEIRFNVEGDGGQLAITPRQIRWPDLEAGIARESVPILVGNPASSSVQLGNASIIGADATSFSIGSDGCSGTVLLAYSTCVIEVTSNDSKLGAARASLLIPEGDLVHEVALSGWTLSGETTLTMTSDPGDVFGQGQTYNYSSADTSFEVRGTPESFGGQIWGPETSWEFGFYSEEALEIGKTYDGMNIDGHPSGYCEDRNGSFTVQELSFTRYGDLEEVAVTFEQRCGTAEASLRGTLHYRYRANHRPLGPDPSAPGLPPVPYERSVSLRLEPYGLVGRVRSATDACYAFVEVRIQKLFPDGWRRLLSPQTHEDGLFGKGNIRRGHVFRAVAPRTEGENIMCERAVSRRVSS